MIRLRTGHALQSRRSRKAAVLNRKTGIRFATTKASDPLRILFCGSDSFSSASLQALYGLQKTHPDLIKSLDVLCRPPKPTGRGLKTYREVPIASVARELGLPLHQADTFRGWKPPKYDVTDSHIGRDDGSINLIVAVSFGLLIPPRILSAAKYGGINVHPSLLPDFRGAAPIQHALLAACRKTGVTLQTLHPTKMDHGQIILQWPEAGLEIPRPDSIKPAELQGILAPLGAIMLVHGIRNGLYVPPIQEVAPMVDGGEHNTLRKASKILPEDHHIRWSEWTAEEITRRQRVLGSLWNNIMIGDQMVRLTFPSQFTVVESDVCEDVPPGVLMYCQSGTQHMSAVWCKSVDGKLLCFNRIKVPGFGEQQANIWARRAQLFTTSNARDVELGSHGTFTLAGSQLV